MASGINTAGIKIGTGIEDGLIFAQQQAEKKAEAAKWDALYGKINTLGKLGMLSAQDADALAGNPVTVTGKIELYKGRPEIVISSPAQIVKER